MFNFIESAQAVGLTINVGWFVEGGSDGLRNELQKFPELQYASVIDWRLKKSSCQVGGVTDCVPSATVFSELA